MVMATRWKKYSKRNTYYFRYRRRLILEMYRKYSQRYKDYLRYQLRKTLHLGTRNDFISFRIPSYGRFPNLKVLNLKLHLTLPNSVFLKRLFRSCPLLEDLYMDITCVDNFDQTFRFCIPTLILLQLKLNADEFDSCRHKEFIINTPNLESLSITDPSLSCFRIHDIVLPSLIQANLSIGKSSYVHDFQVSKDEASRVMEALKGVRNAIDLTLPFGTTSALSYCFDDGDDFPIFPCLLDLQLGIDYCFGWKLLPYFLENSPVLRYISLYRESETKYTTAIAEGKHKEADDTYGWKPPKQVPECLMDRLKNIEVRNLWRRKSECEVVKYLLENGKALEKMRISFEEDGISDEIDEDTIENFPRASESMILKISD
ncbi:hypothetical protein ERO13_A09G213658v2 [Gossypium hirsutum]|uniref:F-box/FBD/LRR-repeat protein At3g52680 n=1 Tax=Gossypium hirsutum TaxID=3635 RepID=A0A1U8LL29_GOSHI|nr:F-box/FBD/LRR-repeat protein At3g52680-like [Gossypium hirsutum]XP_040933148.1 F-box/FBD/LRR-repeat protein At3g52680-like [Gossypium hirsutum]KAG4185169.1 hypothetical protein ERO13_A09G213658v2 [Gossypium hirsutum]